MVECACYWASQLHLYVCNCEHRYCAQNTRMHTGRYLLYFKNGLWFGEDATLRRLPDPLRVKSSRPLMLAADDLDTHLKTYWRKVLGGIK